LGKSLLLLTATFPLKETEELKVAEAKNSQQQRKR
jgi:hypothetical protein